MTQIKPKRICRAHGQLWIKTLNIPATIGAGKAEPVMQPMLSISPKFNFVRHQAKPAPMRRPCHSIGKFFVMRLDLRHQFGAAAKRL